MKPWSTFFVLLFAFFSLLSLLSAAPAQALSAQEAYELRQALNSFGHEPTIYEVQNAALSNRELEEPLQDRWTRRARLSSLLPQIQGQASWLDQRDLRHRFRENIAADDQGLYERNNAQHYLYDDLRLRGLYSLRVSFDLSQLAFHRQEIPIQREIHQRWISSDELLERVTELYFARRRHQIYLRLFPEMEVEEALRHHLAIDALTARIDALTGGWFRQALQKEDPR